MKRSMVVACTLAVVAWAAGAQPAGAPALPTRAAYAAGLARHDGFLPFYWDARQGRVLLDIGRLGVDLLYGAGLAGGAGTVDVALDRGQLGDLGLARFERVGPRVLLHQRQTAHRSDADDPETARAVAESFPSAARASLQVVAEDAGGVLVDATDFLLEDPGLAALLDQAGQGKWRQEKALSVVRLERSGAFPLNTEIEVLLTLRSDQPGHGVAPVLPDERTLSLTVHHTFRALPEAGFEPRPYDPRVGYIVQTHKDYGAPRTESLERRLAPRWRLVKKHPEKALSEPVEPIVFYLDRAFPEPERSVVRAAALWWNHAFEEAGFKDALVVRDLPEGATFLDQRYSGIQWIHRAERAWSIGQFQTDPRTGEILHAVARIDSHRRRTTARQWWNMARPAPASAACAAEEGPEAPWLAAFDVDGVVDEEALVMQRLAYLSAHEVGHTLGLGHNWAGTTFGWGSVMDYLAANVQPKGDGLDLADAFPQDVGAYDRLMVRWGYTPGLDLQARDAVVREAHARGVVYPLDSDPRMAEYDWGADPVSWLRTTQVVRRVILERFGVAQLPAGTPLYDLQARFNLAYLYHRFGIQAAQQHVGGQYQANALAGDGQTPAAWVPAAKQHEALELLLAALEPGELDVPDGVVAALVAAPSGFGASRERFLSEAGPSFSRLTAARSLAGLVLRPLLERQRAARLVLAEGAGALTFDALLERLMAAIWGAPPDAGERAAGLRRVVQRVVLDVLMDLAADAEATPEVRGAARIRLARLRGELGSRSSKVAAAEAHLRLAESDLAAFFDRPGAREPARPTPVPPGRPIGSQP